MRIATLILSLFLAVGVFFQSCVILVGSEIVSGLDQQSSGEKAEDTAELSADAGIGIFVAVLALVGAAFCLGMPRVSLTAYGLGAFFAISTGHTSTFSDLAIWGYLMLGLAVLIFFSQPKERRWPLNLISKKPSPLIPAASHTPICSECGHSTSEGSRYCSACGAAIDSS